MQPSDEAAIFASLLTGEPLLFIGAPGLAKTEIVDVMGSALREYSKTQYPNEPEKWFSYQIYDASKLNFEDLIGYPDINAMKKEPPQVAYIPTKSTIWGKHMIAFDEINRCSEDRQSNLFEIIRSRKLHGIPTNNQFIFSTMNPFGDEGTVSMSDALVDRHLFYLRVNDFNSMQSTERKKVINRVGKVDSVGLRFWNTQTFDLDTSDELDNEGHVKVNQLLADVGQEITNLMLKSSTTFKELKSSYSSQLTEIIDKLITKMASEFDKDSEELKREIAISGRRASAILRGILALRSIELNFNTKKDTMPDLMSTMINAIKLCIPLGISGKLDKNAITRANAVVDNTVRTIWPMMKKQLDTVDIDKISEVINTDNPIKLLDCILTVDMNDITKKKVFSLLLDDNKYKINNTVNIPLRDSIKTIIYKVDKVIPGFIPEHIDLKLSADDIELVSKKTGTRISGPLSDYVEIIMNLVKKCETDPTNYDPVVVFAIKAGILYYSNTIKTNEEAISAVKEISDLVKIISQKLKAIKKNENKTSVSTDKSGPAS